MVCFSNEVQHSVIGRQRVFIDIEVVQVALSSKACVNLCLVVVRRGYSRSSDVPDIVVEGTNVGRYSRDSYEA